MKKYGVSEVRPTVADIGATDNVPAGMTGDVRSGYLEFCRRHPGFDDEALERRRRRGNPEKFRATEKVFGGFPRNGKGFSSAVKRGAK